MKKSYVHKLIKQEIAKVGFERVKGDDYALIAGDGKTKLILRLPDGQRGFLLCAQFPDLGEYNGNSKKCLMRQFDFFGELAFFTVQEFTDEQIVDATRRVVDAYQIYIEQGAEAIKERIEEWSFGDWDEKIRDSVLRYFGLPGIDPYSEEYRKEKVAQMSGSGAICMTLEEYLVHKEFYDGYEAYNATISVDEKQGSVMIHFHYQTPWYQQ